MMHVWQLRLKLSEHCQGLGEFFSAATLLIKLFKELMVFVTYEVETESSSVRILVKCNTIKQEPSEMPAFKKDQIN